MGAEEENTPSKSSKAAASSQETAATQSYPDWSSSMQAYYGAGAGPPFFASTVASPTPHPYMWGGQHPFIPPYGTPVPYPALYPAGGVYVHPNMAMTPNTVQGNAEAEVKTGAVKDGDSTKKLKGNSGSDGGRGGENGNAASGSGNDGASDSAESGSYGSLDASDETNQQEPTTSKKGSFNQMLADGANAQNSASIQASVPGKPMVSMPGTNLNIGMDIWNAFPASAVKMTPNAGVSSAVAPVTLVRHEGSASDQRWNLDERELKRQKRKQSNRESARRSRLRKQAECEELQKRVESLNSENRSLRDELQRLMDECEKIASENTYIKDELSQKGGDQEHKNPSSDHPSQGKEDDS
ncbi:G-box binding factor [Dionaea muscipula]